MSFDIDICRTCFYHF